MTVERLIALAVGQVGMPLADIFQLTLDELSAIYEAWAEAEEARNRTSWEQVRFLAHCSLMPYSKKRLKPEDVVCFPWEGGQKKAKGKPRRLSPEELRKVEERLGV